jgi:hypothetical protein
MFAGPFGVGALAAVVPLGAAVAAIGGAALVGAGLLFRFIPVYSPWPPATPPEPDSLPLEKQEA